MKHKPLKRRVQRGFTLIELIVVIVILGIMAATAIPKFTDLGSDARKAKIQAAGASLKMTAANYHAAWIAKGSATTTTVISFDGTSVTGTTAGYPLATGGVITAAGLSTNDYSITAGAVSADSSHAGTCTATIDDSGNVTFTTTTC